MTYNRTLLLVVIVAALAVFAASGTAAGQDTNETGKCDHTTVYEEDSRSLGDNKTTSKKLITSESSIAYNSPPGVTPPRERNRSIPDPVQVGNNTKTGNFTAASVDDSSVIQEDFSINRTPSDIGTIAVEYSVTIPENVVELDAYIPSSASVVSRDGFSYNTVEDNWKASSSRGTESQASLTYTAKTNKTSFGGFNTVETPEWAFVSYRQLGIRTTYRYYSPQPTYEEEIDIERQGYVTDSKYGFLGPVSTQQQSTSGQTITVVVPQVTDPNRSPSMVLDDLTEVSEFLEIGKKSSQTTGIVLPEPIRGGGQSRGDSFWVQENSVKTVHIHEYIHTRQGWGRESTFEWSIEGSADYYQGYLAWNLLDIYNKDRFYRYASTNRNENAVLQDDDSQSTEQKNYYKGRRVLTALDIRIRKHTDGNHTLQTIFDRLNSKFGRSNPASYSEFRSEAISLTNSSTGPWLDKYVQTSSVPQIPENIGAAYSNNPSPPEFDVELKSTNSPIIEGGVLNIIATVENTGGNPDNQKVQLDLGKLKGPSEDYSESISLDEGESEIVNFSLPTSSGDDGEYTVTVSSNNDSDSTNVTVKDNAPDSSFTYTPSSPDTTDTVVFDGSASSDPDGSLRSYAWEFGDGTTATGENVSHSYANAGNYTVTLTVTDDSGLTDTDSETVSVSSQSTGPLPSENPFADPTGGPIGELDAINALTSWNEDGQIDGQEYGELELIQYIVEWNEAS
jgi:hypothetical protein